MVTETSFESLSRAYESGAHYKHTQTLGGQATIIFCFHWLPHSPQENNFFRAEVSLRGSLAENEFNKNSLQTFLTLRHTKQNKAWQVWISCGMH